jgi:hypothetical protein
MPNITLPLVKPEPGTGGFTCPKCKAKCATHIEFVQHFAAAHAAIKGARRREPRITPAPPPKAVGGDQVTCPICQRKVPGSDYAEHAKTHADGGITAAAFNQEEPR